MKSVRLGAPLTLILSALLGFGQSGCGRPTFIAQQYPGPARPAETISVIRVDGDSPVQLLSIDGEAADARVSSDARLHVEELPGKHTVWVQNLARPESPPGSVVFQSEAGRVYRVVFVVAPGPQGFVPRVYLVDRDSDALKKDVTLPAEAAKAASPQVVERSAAGDRISPQPAPASAASTNPAAPTPGMSQGDGPPTPAYAGTSGSAVETGSPTSASGGAGAGPYPAAHTERR